MCFTFCLFTDPVEISSTAPAKLNVVEMIKTAYDSMMFSVKSRSQATAERKNAPSILKHVLSGVERRLQEKLDMSRVFLTSPDTEYRVNASYRKVNYGHMKPCNLNTNHVFCFLCSCNYLRN